MRQKVPALMRTMLVNGTSLVPGSEFRVPSSELRLPHPNCHRTASTTAKDDRELNSRQDLFKLIFICARPIVQLTRPQMKSFVHCRTHAHVRAQRRPAFPWLDEFMIIRLRIICVHFLNSREDS